MKKIETTLKGKPGEVVMSSTLRTEARRRIELIPYEEIKPFVDKSKAISQDIKDVQYIALALKFHIGIWSNDKALKEKQKEIGVYSTDEVMNM